MKRNFAIFWLFSKYSFKAIMQNPISSMFFLLGKLLRFGMLFIFLYMLLSHAKTLASYSFNQTFIFFITFSIIDTASQLLFREVYRFRPLVVNGELDAILVKPYHPFLRVLFGGLDLLDLLLLFPYTFLLIYFINQAHIFSFMQIFLFILLIGNGLLIATALHIYVLALGIFTTEVDHMIMVFRDLGRLGMVPTDIYQEPFRFFITFVIPIGLMMTIPVKGLFGLLSGEIILLSFILSGIMISSALFAWDRAIKQYQSWGG